MSVLVLLDLPVKPEATEDLKASMKAILPETRAYDGCQSVSLYNNTDEGSNFMLSEVWDSRAHQERYIAWRTETGVMAQLAAILSGPPVIRYFELVDA